MNVFILLFIDSFKRGSSSNVRDSVSGSARVEIVSLLCLAIDWMRVEGCNTVKIGVIGISSIEDWDMI